MLSSVVVFDPVAVAATHYRKTIANGELGATLDPRSQIACCNRALERMAGKRDQR
jgi:hypothetical protein